MMDKERELCDKIFYIKEAFEEFKEISLELKEKGIYFLWNQQDRVTGSYKAELDRLRKELCIERGE